MERVMDDYELREGAVLSLRSLPTGAALRCESGAVAVSVDGDASDRVLRRGDAFVVERDGHVAVRVLRNSRVQVRREAA